MNYLSDGIVVIGPGENIPDGTADSIKLYLGGTIDFNPANDWRTKFCNSLVQLSNPFNGMPEIKGFGWVIFNPVANLQNQELTLQNSEYVNMLKWRMDMMEQSTVIFSNILNKSEAYPPILETGAFLNSGKLVLRVGDQHKLYPHIRLYCERLNVPLLTGRTNVREVLLAMKNIIPPPQANDVLPS